MSQAALVVRGAEPRAISFSPDQRKLILDTCCNGASETEAQALVAMAEVRGLNPLHGDCYFVQRWDSAKNRMVWAVQSSIDGFRMKAEETGVYDGQDEPDFEYDDAGKLVLARVKVYRKDWSRPAVGVARLSEYIQTKKDGTPTSFWQKMPHNQLAKCAEALAFRKAFPRQLSKIYIKEEMPDPQAEVAQAHKPGVAKVAATITGDGEVIEDTPEALEGALRASTDARGTADDLPVAAASRQEAGSPGASQTGVVPRAAPGQRHSEDIAPADEGAKKAEPIATEAEMDGRYGNPSIRFNPRGWKGPSMVGKNYSDCPPDYLRQLAHVLEGLGKSADEKGEVHEKSGKPMGDFKRFDAKLARGWAARIAGGWGSQREPGED